MIVPAQNIHPEVIKNETINSSITQPLIQGS